MVEFGYILSNGRAQNSNIVTMQHQGNGKNLEIK
jgi:hypothetical protein